MKFRALKMQIIKYIESIIFLFVLIIIMQKNIYSIFSIKSIKFKLLVIKQII